MKDLSLHILDIANNSIRAGASLVTLAITENTDDDTLIICITDDGCGMTEEELKMASDPFFTSRKTRKVGLGIPLFKQNAEQTGGWLKLQSTKGKGTRIEAMFRLSHLDRPPMGDLASVFVLLMAGTQGVEFELNYATPVGKYSISSVEIKDILDDVPLTEIEVQKQIEGLILSNLLEIRYTK
jgi:hypothetical protein